MILVLDDTIVIHPHAVARFSTRCRPGLVLVDAEAELIRLVSAHGTVSATRPRWYTGRSAHAYLVVGDVAFLLAASLDRERLVAVTCVVRGGYGSVGRAARTRQRRDAKRRQRNRGRRP